MPDGPVRDAEIPAAEDPRAPEGDAERAAEHEQEWVPDARLLRALADVDNLRKRFDREVARARADERARAAQSWLPVVDNLELALDHAGPECTPLAEGLRAVRDQAVALLAALGFSRFEDVGETFDPAPDEALAVGRAGPECSPPAEGLRAVRAQAVALLAALGFPRFEDVGETFDPARDEALAVVETGAPSGTVVATLRPGYGTAESMLRPAGV